MNLAAALKLLAELDPPAPRRARAAPQATQVPPITLDAPQQAAAPREWPFPTWMGQPLVTLVDVPQPARRGRPPKAPDSTGVR